MDSAQPTAVDPDAPRFVIERRLASGGFGSVYRATMRRDGADHPVAIKLLHTRVLDQDPKAVAILADEARLLSRLDHPAIVTLEWFGQLQQAGGRTAHALAMEFIDGWTLKEAMRACRDAERPLPPECVVEIFWALAGALDCAHSVLGDDGQPLGLIHRDLKPGNVMIDRQGRTRLLDFGIAKARDRLQDRTRSGHTRGTAYYMSPEQVTGLRELDARSDLFSLGALLYEAVVGERLFRKGSIVHVIRQIAAFDPTQPLQRLAAVAPELVDPLRGCLQPDPDDRWPTAAELAARLQPLRVPDAEDRLADHLLAVLEPGEQPEDADDWVDATSAVETLSSLDLRRPGARPPDQLDPPAELDEPGRRWVMALVGGAAVAAIVGAAMC